MSERDTENVVSFEGVQVALVRCDGCGAQWQDLEAATHVDGYSKIGCPNRCHCLTTPVYWPAESGQGWQRAEP